MNMDKTSYHIAVVEDDSTILKYHSQLLKRSIENCKILEFETICDSFYKTANSTPIDLFIMDIHLGKQNGIDITNNLLKTRKGLTILFISGYDYTFDSFKQFDGRCIYDYVAKPIESEELNIRVKALLNISNSFNKVLKHTNGFENDCVDITLDGLRKKYFEQIEKDRLMIQQLRSQTLGK